MNVTKFMAPKMNSLEDITRKDVAEYIKFVSQYFNVSTTRDTLNLVRDKKCPRIENALLWDNFGDIFRGRGESIYLLDILSKEELYKIAMYYQINWRKPGRSVSYKYLDEDIKFIIDLYKDQHITNGWWGISSKIFSFTGGEKMKALLRIDIIHKFLRRYGFYLYEGNREEALKEGGAAYALMMRNFGNRYSDIDITKY